MAEYVTHPNMSINQAIIFATSYHGNQVRKGTQNLPYIFHPIDVAQEIIMYAGLSTEDTLKATIAAILHDTLEDTDATLDNIEKIFGTEMSLAIAALSKDEGLSDSEKVSKEESLRENLIRIKEAPKWVWCVKLADRKSNLKVFPKFWSREKIGSYLHEAKIISDELGAASLGLNAKLLGAILDNQTKLAIAA